MVSVEALYRANPVVQQDNADEEEDHGRDEGLPSLHPAPESLELPVDTMRPQQVRVYRDRRGRSRKGGEVDHRHTDAEHAHVRGADRESRSCGMLGGF